MLFLGIFVRYQDLHIGIWWPIAPSPKYQHLPQAYSIRALGNTRGGVACAYKRGDCSACKCAKSGVFCTPACNGGGGGRGANPNCKNYDPAFDYSKGVVPGGRWATEAQRAGTMKCSPVN